MPSYTLSNYQNIIANGQTVNKVVSVHNGTSTTVWKRLYTFYLRAGDYVNTIRYKINNGSWSSAESLHSIQCYYGDTIYWEVVSRTSDYADNYSDWSNYSNTQIRQSYTWHSFSGNSSGNFAAQDASYNTYINWSESTSTRYNYSTRYYSASISRGDYVSTFRYKIGNGSWSGAVTSASINQQQYNTIVYWELVSYNTSDAQYTYDGPTSGSFYIQNGSQTVSRTRKVNQYTVSWTTANCSVIVRKGATNGTIISSGTKVDYGTWIYVSASANNGYLMNSYDSSFMVTGNTTKSYSAYQASKTATVKLWIDGYDDDGYNYDVNSCVVNGSGTINNITLTGGPSGNLLRFNIVTSSWSSVLDAYVSKGTNYWDINRSGSGLRMYLSPGHSDPWGTYEVTLLINYTGNLTFTT